jgi:hypothetical protein
MVRGRTRPGDEVHASHIDGRARCIEMEHELRCPLVRLMSGRKEMILWGSHGAEQWNVAKGAWDARCRPWSSLRCGSRGCGRDTRGQTGDGAMVHSADTGRRLCEAIGSPHLKVLRDPANACYAHERAWPDGYAELKRGWLGHLHIKDVQVDTPRALLEVREIGKGQLADHSSRSPGRSPPTATRASCPSRASTTRATATSRPASGPASAGSSSSSAEGGRAVVSGRPPGGRQPSEMADVAGDEAGAVDLGRGRDPGVGNFRHYVANTPPAGTAPAGREPTRSLPAVGKSAGA